MQSGVTDPSLSVPKYGWSDKGGQGTDDIHTWWEIPCIAHFCSLFRASFNLIDFDIEDLEEALLTDESPEGGSGNTLIQELMVRLLRGIYTGSNISAFNYQMFLRRLFRAKCKEYACYNPFNNDVDLQFLPLRTKVEIIHMLCDFRLDCEDVMDMLKAQDLDADSLRVHPLGYDVNKSAYWYFYGTRLYKEDYPHLIKKRKEREKRRAKRRKEGLEDEDSESDDEKPFARMGTGVWQVACFTERDWEKLAIRSGESTNRDELALHQVLMNDFLPEIPHLFAEKERLQRKRFLEFHPRKSSRIEKIKQRKEEEKKFLDEYKRALLGDTDSEEEGYEKAKKQRYERWLNRNNIKALNYGEDGEEQVDDTKDGEGCQEDDTENGETPKGKQTNNSPSSTADQIVISSSGKSSLNGYPMLEDLHIGMYKVLNKLKDHEDAWPFLEPVDEESAPSYYDVVKHPICLQWMEEKLDRGLYHTFTEFRKDFELILENCRKYNGTRNEYTEMGGNLERAFKSAVNRYLDIDYTTSESDEYTDDELPQVIGAHRKKRKKRRRYNSGRNYEDGNKENEDSISSRYKRIAASHYQIENGNDYLGGEENEQGNPDENKTLEALDNITEQALRDINKWLDDDPGPKEPEFDDCSVQPLPVPTFDSSNGALEYGSCGYFDTPATSSSASPRSQFSPPRFIPSSSASSAAMYRRKYKKQSRRPKEMKNHSMAKEGGKSVYLKRNNHLHRPIARLQPGKSKGNLLNSKGNNNTVKTTFPDDSGVPTITVEHKEHVNRPKPMLSLGSVLSNVTFGASPKKPNSDDNASDEGEEATETNPAPVSQDIVLPLEKEKVPEENEEKPENPVKKDTGESTKLEKPAPNLSAWLKAFGTPKTAQKKRPDSEVPATPAPAKVTKINSPPPATPAPYMPYIPKTGPLQEDKYDVPPPTPGRFFMYEEEKEKKSTRGPLSPEITPADTRQRRNSTGSSVSEHSSFSQDPNDPLNSPHPSLDEPYVSPQPLHLSPVHNTNMRAGFYQDTFPRGGSDKSTSCSPRTPLSITSPISPKDALPNHSPNELQKPPVYYMPTANTFYGDTNSNIASPGSACSQDTFSYSAKKSIHEQEENGPRAFTPTATNKGTESLFTPTLGQMVEPAAVPLRFSLMEPSPENILLASSTYYRHNLYPTNAKPPPDSLDYLNKPPSTPSVNVPAYNENGPLDYTNSSNKNSQYEYPSTDGALNFSNKAANIVTSYAADNVQPSQSPEYSLNSAARTQYRYSELPQNGPKNLCSRDTKAAECKGFYPDSKPEICPSASNVYLPPGYGIPDLRYSSYSQPQESKGLFTAVSKDEPPLLYPRRSTPVSSSSSYSPLSNFTTLAASSFAYNFPITQPQSFAPRAIGGNNEAPATKTPGKRGRKKKVTSQDPVIPSSTNSIYNSDLKNGQLQRSAFNFTNSIKSDYQQYFENLRSSSGYFADTPGPAKSAPGTPTPHFPYLTPDAARSSFPSLAQAFMNPHNGHCPPLYTSPYLQRPPDELLRPMMLQQSLLPSHPNGYPASHGFFNMHDPIGRSPWC